MKQTTLGSTATVTAIEYFNASLGHYFVTAHFDEIALLDGGAFNGAFARTGSAFCVWDGPPEGTSEVCRFFSTPGTFGAKSSHFYSAFATECVGLRSDPNWRFVGTAFHIAVPTAGVCQHGTAPVYRLYNNGQGGAPNHRFTTDLATYQQFIGAKDWIGEGVVFCAPGSVLGAP